MRNTALLTLAVLALTGSAAFANTDIPSTTDEARNMNSDYEATVESEEAAAAEDLQNIEPAAGAMDEEPRGTSTREENKIPVTTDDARNAGY